MFCLNYYEGLFIFGELALDRLLFLFLTVYINKVLVQIISFRDKVRTCLFTLDLLQVARFDSVSGWKIEIAVGSLFVVCV